jgi:hypothetical protein
MARLSRGQLLIIIGVSLLSLGFATSFALGWLGGRIDTQLKMILYLLISFLTAAGLILIFYGARKLMPVDIHPFPPLGRGPFN